MGKFRYVCHLECWSIVVNHGSLLDVNEVNLRKLCTYEYGIDITPEMYHSIRENELHGYELDRNRTKFCYFKKSIREVPEDAYM